MNTNYDEIRRLFEKFLDGKTTPQENSRLSDFLKSDNIPEEFLIYREMFATILSPMAVPSDEELKLFAQENGLELTEEPNEKKEVWILSRWTKIAAVAASLIIVFFLGFELGDNSQNVIPEVKETVKLVEKVTVKTDTVVLTVEAEPRVIVKEIVVKSSDLAIVQDTAQPIVRESIFNNAVNMQNVYPYDIALYSADMETDEQFAEMQKSIDNFIRQNTINDPLYDSYEEYK